MMNLGFHKVKKYPNKLSNCRHCEVNLCLGDVYTALEKFDPAVYSRMQEKPVRVEKLCRPRDIP
jgi:hypothetical protein